MIYTPATTLNEVLLKHVKGGTLLKVAVGQSKMPQRPRRRKMHVKKYDVAGICETCTGNLPKRS